VESLDRWLKGPKFLLSNVFSFPEPIVDHTPNSSVEFAKLTSFPVTVASKPLNIVANPDRFSSWLRLLRATARAHQFLRLLRKKDTSYTGRGLYPLDNSSAPDSTSSCRIVPELPE
jgi:hypothetical protein